MAKKVYAIKEGFDSANNKKVENIIVNTWAECLKYVKGVKGAKYKSFERMEDADEFLYNSNDVLKKEDNNYPNDCLHIYVDGSYNIATGEYSYGLAAVKDEIVVYVDSGKAKSNAANNIRQIAGELEAAVKGVQFALEKGEKKVVIFHDYIGICYHATGFWERKEESSKEYYRKMQELMNSGIEVIFVKVDSHTGDLFNELADEKCKEELGITSDRVVEKWLASNIIYVADEKVKSKLISLAGTYADSLVLMKNKSDKIASKVDKKENKQENEQKDLEYLISTLKQNKKDARKIINKLKSAEKTEVILKLLEL